MSRGRQRASTLTPVEGFEEIRTRVAHDIAPVLRERARALDQLGHTDELVGAARRFLMAGDVDACQSALECAHRQALSRAQAAQVGNMIDNYTDQARTIERWRNDLSGLIPQFLADQLRSEGGYPERLHAEVSRALAEAIRCGERQRALALFEAYRRDGEKSPWKPSLTSLADQRATQLYLEFVRADDDGWARAQIIARAEAFLEAPIWPWATEGPAVSGRRLAEIRAHLAGGDRAERDGGDHLFGDLDLDRQRALPATSAAQALSFVRAMLRSPGRYRDPNDDADEREWIGEIVVEEAAMRELIRDRPEVLYDTPGPGRATLHIGPADAAGLCRHHVSLPLRPMTDGGRVVLGRLSLDLGNDREAVFQWIAGLHAIGMEVSKTILAASPPVHLRLQSALGYNTRRGRIDVSRLLGRESCTHPRGRWVPSRVGEMVSGAAALRLSCPDCLRERATLVPAHRLPADHPLRAQIDERPYLGAERYRRALTGHDPSVVPDSLAELCALEPAVSLDPADWSSGGDGRDSGPREDIVAALGRRRR